MKMTFKEFLTEARIAVPTTTKKEVMSIVASAYFNYVVQLLGKQGKRPGQGFMRALRKARQEYGPIELYNYGPDDTVRLQGKATFYAKELPDRYKSRNLKDSKLTVDAGDFGMSKDAIRGLYYSKVTGRPGAIVVNIRVPGMEENVGHPNSIQDDLEELEGIIDHELQHSTQDSALRQKHKSQFDTDTIHQDTQSPEGRESYYKSTVEFQPQITTAVNEFKRSLSALRSRTELTEDQIKGVLRSFLTGGPMPTGMLKWKPYFNSEFFQTLHKTSPVKWKKAVKDFHGLLSKTNSPNG